MNLIAKLRKRKFLSFIIIVIVLVGFYYWYQKSHSSTGQVSYITKAVQRNTIISTVTGSGQVSEQNKIDLKPQGSGQSTLALTSVTVKQGDSVKAGQIIATVDQKNNLNSLNQAKASLASAQANYDKVVTGLSPEDIKVAKASLASSELSYENAKLSYDNTVKQQQLTVANSYSNLLNSTMTAVPDKSNLSGVSISISGGYTDIKEGRYNIYIETSGYGYNYHVIGIGDDMSGQIIRGVPLPLGSRGLFLTFSNTGTISIGDMWTVIIPNVQGGNYLSNYNSYQSALQAQSIALSNAQASLNSAQAALVIAQANYDLKMAPVKPQDIATAKAQVINTEAQLQSAQTLYDGNFIKAPFDGIVAQLNNQAGDQVSSSNIIATIITAQKLAVISLNEVDVAKIKISQKVNLTFDAIDGLNITGEVVQINDIGVLSQGVVTYSVKIAFDTQDSRIKPGMSVNAAIITNIKNDVLTIPNSAVKSDSNGYYVQMLDASGNPQSKIVQIGIANDTLTEVTSGLDENDMVVTQIIDPNTVKTNTSNGGGLRIPGLGGGGHG